MSDDIIENDTNVAVKDEQPVDSAEQDLASDSDTIIDVITGDKRVKDTPKERVRQTMAQSLATQYGIAFEDMEAEFRVGTGKNRKVIDIAIFHPGTKHDVMNLSRAVICRPEPTVGRNARLRIPEEAKKEWQALQEIMEQVESCEYGLWTNQLDIFYFKKLVTRFEIRLEAMADWPRSGESENTASPTASGSIYKAEKDRLRMAFRRCHNYIHGNEGMPKDAAFREFLYLIFCKMYDEDVQGKPNYTPRFWVSMVEQFAPEQQAAVKQRIDSLFEDVKQNYKEIFRGNEEITLSPRALTFIVSELYRYNFTKSEIDAKGAAYQEIVGTNLRGDRGQYFTPRGVVKLAVKILDPHKDERVLDPACGTGGFLVATLDYMLAKFCAEQGIDPKQSNREDQPGFAEVRAKLKAFAEHNVFGADFDPFLIKASQMNMVMAGDGRGHLYHVNSLEFPHGHMTDVSRARSEIGLGTIDVLMTNPPFGSDIPITEMTILEQYDLARTWEADEDKQYRIVTEPGRRMMKSNVAPEILFIERCLQWLRPGGRMAIVLPNGILGNPADAYIRQWILKNAWVLASIDIPIEAFVVEANVNILTSLLFLKKKTNEEIRAEALSNDDVEPYPVFMAVAEKVGVDRRGNILYKRKPDGEIEERIEWEERHIQRDERVVTHRKQIRKRIIDDDLPIIAEKYHEFRQHYLEPGE